VKRHHEAGCNPINFVVIALLPRRALQVFDFHRLDLHGGSPDFCCGKAISKLAAHLIGPV
jgi:hypothetical protein